MISVCSKFLFDSRDFWASIDVLDGFRGFNLGGSYLRRFFCIHMLKNYKLITPIEQTRFSIKILDGFGECYWL